MALAALWRNYSLSLILATLFLLSWLAQGVFQWQEFVNTQQEHEQAAEVVDFIPEFLSRTFENWQSEFLQLLTFVSLTTYFIHRGSPESKDGDKEIKASLSRIERAVTSKK